VLDVGAGDDGPMLAGAAAQPAVKESGRMVEQAEVGPVTTLAFGGGRIEAFQIPGGPGVPLLVLGGVELGFRPLAGMEQVLRRRWERRAAHRPVTVLGRPIAVKGEEAGPLLN